MSKQKDFNQGIETGMKISKELLNKESQAMDYVKNKIDELGNSHGRLENAVNHILENQNSKAIEEYYGIVNGLSPKDLEKEECQILLNILSILAFEDEEYNDMQKSYFLNLKKYLQVTEYAPDIEYRLEYIEKIRDLDSQEIIMRCIREFLFLRHFDFSFQMDYEELFEYFSVNDKKIQQLDNMIEITYFLFGGNGIVEMYGNHESDEVVEDNHEDFENEIVDTPAGKKYVIKNQEIYWININEYLQDISNKDVKIVEFYKCKVLYNYSASQTHITLNEDQRMIFDTCELISGEEVDISRFIIECNKRAQVLFINSILDHPQNLVIARDDDIKIRIEDSKISFPMGVVFYVARENSELEIKKSKILIDNATSDCVFSTFDFRMFDSEVLGIEISDENKQVDECFFACQGYIKNCMFKYLRNPLHMRKGIIENSSFLSCENILYEEKDIKLKQCYFKECTHVRKWNNQGSIYRIQDSFFDRCTMLFDGEIEVYMQNSYFTNIKGYIFQKLCGGTLEKSIFNYILCGEKDYDGYTRNMIDIYKEVEFKECKFENIDMDQTYFIGCNGSSSFNLLKLNDCVMKNCTTRREDGIFFKTEVEERIPIKKYYRNPLDRLMKRSFATECESTGKLFNVAEITNLKKENCSKRVEPINDFSYVEVSEEYVSRVIIECKIGYSEFVGNVNKIGNYES